MKNLFVAILALFYLSVASGVTVNLHYCMGELASVEYGHGNESGECGKCGMPDDNNACCRTESTLVKLQDDHQLSTQHPFFKQPEAVQAFVPASASLTSVVRSSVNYACIHSPPDGQPDPLYLHNCVFRI